MLFKLSCLKIVMSSCHSAEPFLTIHFRYLCIKYVLADRHVFFYSFYLIFKNYFSLASSLIKLFIFVSSLCTFMNRIDIFFFFFPCHCPLLPIWTSLLDPISLIIFLYFCLYFICILSVFCLYFLTVHLCYLHFIFCQVNSWFSFYGCPPCITDLIESELYFSFKHSCIFPWFPQQACAQTDACIDACT